MVQELEPDVILMDLVMPGMDGLEATIRIKGQNSETRILILTSFEDQDRIQAIIAAGASGYLMKDTGAEGLMQAIRSIHSGQVIFSPNVWQTLSASPQEETAAPRSLDDLTPRELEVLQCIVDGQTNQEIAGTLSISDTTVRSHVSTILSKLHVSNRTQAAMVARENELV